MNNDVMFQIYYAALSAVVTEKTPEVCGYELYKAFLQLHDEIRDKDIEFSDIETSVEDILKKYGALEPDTDRLNKIEHDKFYVSVISIVENSNLKDFIKLSSERHLQTENIGSSQEISSSYIYDDNANPTHVYYLFDGNTYLYYLDSDVVKVVRDRPLCTYSPREIKAILTALDGCQAGETVAIESIVPWRHHLPLYTVNDIEMTIRKLKTDSLYIHGVSEQLEILKGEIDFVTGFNKELESAVRILSDLEIKLSTNRSENV